MTSSQDYARQQNEQLLPEQRVCGTNARKSHAHEMCFNLNGITLILGWVVDCDLGRRHSGITERIFNQIN